MRQPSQTDRQLRKEITADILQRVRRAVQEEFVGTPQTLTFRELNEIKRAMLGSTRRIVDALSFDEIRSEGALLNYIVSARIETNRRIRELRPPVGNYSHS